MKETLLSTCEKAFVLQAIAEGRRLDGRGHNEHRNLQIHYGSDFGCCQVTLGLTRVLAQVSCEVRKPKSTRPEEGILLIYVELSPMAAPHIEAGRSTDLGVQLNRILEKCFKDTRCLDLNSLCIKVDEKVWAVRVDVTILNHEGNLADAAAIATLAALAHFKVPDFTIEGEKLIIHPLEEKTPIPLSIMHFPICVSFAIFNKGDHILADPTEIEERVSEASLVFGMNGYRELCGVHLGGSALASPEMILQCAHLATVRAKEVITYIKQQLAKDTVDRASGKEVGFMTSISSKAILALKHDSISLRLNSSQVKSEARKLLTHKKDAISEVGNEAVNVEEEKEVMDICTESDEEVTKAVPCGENSAELMVQQVKIGEGGPSQWEVSSDSGSSIEVTSEDEKMQDDKKDENVEIDEDDADVELVKEISFQDRLKVMDSIELSGDSEEEETTTLHPHEVNEACASNSVEKDTMAKKKENVDKNEVKPVSTSRGWYQSSW